MVAMALSSLLFSFIASSFAGAIRRTSIAAAPPLLLSLPAEHVIGESLLSRPGVWDERESKRDRESSRSKVMTSLSVLHFSRVV